MGGSELVSAESLDLSVTDDGLLTLTVGGWPGLRLGPLDASLILANGSATAATRHVVRDGEHGAEVRLEYAHGLTLTRRFRAGPPSTVMCEAELTNASTEPVEVRDIRLLAAAGEVAFGQTSPSLRFYEQGSYWSRVRTLGADGPSGVASGEQDAAQQPIASSSQYVWVAYDASARMALIVGFETGDRWTGEIRTESVYGRIKGWSAGFGCGDTLLRPGETWKLESLTLAAGHDPWRLLCDYGDRVMRRHRVAIPDRSPVSWCSWYPYRLGVSEDRVRATAAIARERLVKLGLSVLVLDLGWQAGYLPSSFAENEQFASGLRALADELERDGLKLGAWCAPFTISAHDPLAREHPEWLLGSARDTEGNHLPQPTGTWFWQPHGETYALDLTHPGARAWLRERMRSLADRGVRYLKPDFIGGASAGHLTARHDRTVVAGGGAEAARLGLSIMHEEIIERHPGALILNCGGPELPGKGSTPLLYTCADTGNTGYVGWNHLKDDYGRNVAGHLWKNRRWGIIQPSCMVVGLPGTIEEARVRATATFLAGGQVDIGDNLLNLPEERWHVLTATLPPLGVSATPVDLFDPIETASLGYDASASGRGGDAAGVRHDASSVWALPVKADWDDWTLVGLFNYDTNDDVEYGKASITRFRLPLERIGLVGDAPHAVLEFWDSQYLGTSPFIRANPGGYTHPGDAQSLIVSLPDGRWEVAFFGPGVKLLIVRRAREHPWPVGTSFHQSGGTELTKVTWREPKLSGVLVRPAGQTGSLVIAVPAGWTPIEARVGNRRVPARRGANGSLVVPVVSESDRTVWDVQFRRSPGASSGPG